jgi:hypothetical protein
MDIRKEDVLRFFFSEKRTIEEIAKIYGVTPHKFKKILLSEGINLSRVKSCKTCGAGKNRYPPENSGGMSFELTKD